MHSGMGVLLALVSVQLFVLSDRLGRTNGRWNDAMDIYEDFEMKIMS